MKTEAKSCNCTKNEMYNFFNWSKSFGVFVPFNENVPITLMEAYIEYTLQQEELEGRIINENGSTG